MKNLYEIKEDYALIYIKRKDGSEFSTLIDIEDLEKVKSFKNSWNLVWSPGTESFYVVGYYKSDKKTKSIGMHRYILGANEHMVVDHINHDTLDNRRSNVRIITFAENQQNRKGAQRNSKSGIRGVSWDANKNKWFACIYVNSKRIYLGVFSDMNEAEKVVVEARRKYMPFSLENSVNVG